MLQLFNRFRSSIQLKIAAGFIGFGFMVLIVSLLLPFSTTTYYGAVGGEFPPGYVTVDGLDSGLTYLNLFFVTLIVLVSFAVRGTAGPVTVVVLSAILLLAIAIVSALYGASFGDPYSTTFGVGGILLPIGDAIVVSGSLIGIFLFQRGELKEQDLSN